MLKSQESSFPSMITSFAVHIVDQCFANEYRCDLFQSTCKTMSSFFMSQMPMKNGDLFDIIEYLNGPAFLKWPIDIFRCEHLTFTCPRTDLFLPQCATESELELDAKFQRRRQTFSLITRTHDIKSLRLHQSSTRNHCFWHCSITYIALYFHFSFITQQ